MRHLVTEHFELFLCLLILLSRIGDIGSTYLATPSLVLEANPIVRKLGWRFALLTLLVCLVPYLSTEMGILVLVPSLLVSASNTSKIWFMRTYGEMEYRELVLSLARKSKLSHAVACVLGSASFTFLVGFILMFLSPDPHEWGYWFAAGIMVYAVVVAFHGSLYCIRLFGSSLF